MDTGTNSTFFEATEKNDNYNFVQTQFGAGEQYVK